VGVRYISQEDEELLVLTSAGDFLGPRQQHGAPNRDWSDAVTEEEEQEQLRQRESSGYRGGRPRYRGGGRGGRREGFNTGTGYRPPQSRKLCNVISAIYKPPMVCSRKLITGCSVAQHCCKGDQPFQWETSKIWPSYFPNPLIFPRQNLYRWLHPAYLPMCKIWWKSVYGGLPHE